MRLRSLMLGRRVVSHYSKVCDCQKLEGDILRPTLDRITFMVPPSLRGYEETIFNLKQIIDLVS